MSIAKTVGSYLQQRGIAYTVVHHPRAVSGRETARAARVPADQIAKAVVVADEAGLVMVVVPANRYVMLEQLAQMLGRPLTLASESRIASVFNDCELGAIPPVGPAYGIDTFMDDGLLGQDQVCFVAGDHEDLVCVEGEEFQRLLREARHGRFSH